MLVFDRPLAKESVGVGRWTSMVLGIAGSYGKDDAVDVVYRSGGRNKVAAKLRFEPLRPTDGTTADGPDGRATVHRNTARHTERQPRLRVSTHVGAFSDV